MNQLLLGHPAYEVTERALIPAEPEKLTPGVALRLDALAKSFGRISVLADIDLAVQPGEFLAIVGHSGSGKSTLLRLLAGLEPPSSGEIELDGSGLRGRAVEARLMFQEARLLPWRNVAQNVLIGTAADADPAAAEAVLAQVGLADRARAWPAELSGGQRQRVALARFEMQDLIERVWRNQGFTAILVTHDVAEAVRLADRVIVLERGRVAETWPVSTPRPRPRAGGATIEIQAAILARLLGR